MRYTNPIYARLASLLIVLGLAGLSACSRQVQSATDAPVHVPVTGAAQGVTVPNSLPGAQTLPRGASAAGSAL